MPRAHLLVIEDDRAIRDSLTTCLELADFLVTAAADFPSGKRAALGVDADLVLLDLVLPGGDGLDILAALRAARPALPVFVLTARGAESDRVRGLKGGADDYVVKPFGVDELVARVEAVLRRAGAKAAPTGGTVTVPGAVVDFAQRSVRRDDGSEEVLSVQETDLVRLLAERRDRAVPREELWSVLWRTSAPDLGSRAVDMLVARVRCKLGDAGREPRALLTVRGCGYRLVVES